MGGPKLNAQSAPRAEWSDQDHDKEFDGEALDDPFAQLELEDEDGQLIGRSKAGFPIRFRQPGHTPSEASDVDPISQALLAEIFAITSKNSKFEAFTRDQVLDAAVLLVQNTITALDAFRTTDDVARRYLFEDIGKKTNVLHPRK